MIPDISMFQQLEQQYASDEEDSKLLDQSEIQQWRAKLEKEKLEDGELDESTDFKSDNARYRYQKGDELNEEFDKYDLKAEDIEQIDCSFITRFKCYFQKTKMSTIFDAQKIPYLHKIISLCQCIMKIHKQSEKAKVVPYEREDLLELIKAAKQIYLRLPKICFKFPQAMRKSGDRQNFQPRLYKTLVMDLWTLIKYCLEGEPSNEDNIDAFRPLICEIFGLAASLNSLMFLLNSIRNQTESGQVPQLIKDIINKEYYIIDYEILDINLNLIIKLNRTLLIYEKVISDTYRLKDLLNEDLGEKSPLEFLNPHFTETTQAIQMQCQTILNNQGRHLNATYSIVNIIYRCVVEPFQKLCHLIEESRPDQSVCYDYKPSINDAVFKLLELRIFFSHQVKIGKEKTNELQPNYEEEIKEEEMKQQSEEEEVKESFQNMMVNKKKQEEFKSLTPSERHNLRQKTKEQYYQTMRENIWELQEKIELKIEDIIQILDPEHICRLSFSQSQSQIMVDTHSMSMMQDISVMNQDDEEQHKSSVMIPTEDFIKSIQERLENDKNRDCNSNDKKEILKQLLIRSNINQSELDTYMKFVYDMFQEYYTELKEGEQKDYALKKELVGRLLHFLVNCLTKIRAFNLTSSLVEQIGRYFDFVSQNSKISTKKLRRLRLALVFCFERLTEKYKNDENLKDNEEFGKAYEEFRVIYEKLNAIVKEYFGNLMQDQLLRNEEQNILRKCIGTVRESAGLQKNIKKMINIVYDRFRVFIKGKHFIRLYGKLREDLKTCLDIFTDQDILVQGYGLSGAGILFINSTIKTQVRVINATKQAYILKERFQNEDLENQEVLLCKESWFQVVSCQDERYFYLKLVNNDMRMDYNGLIFKLKVQHLNSRRETKLAWMLKGYINYQKSKLKKLIFFWLFYLKINGVMGVKNGYLSGTTYMIMFINYMQTQYLVPNFQGKEYNPRVDIKKERLSQSEYANIKSRIRTENLERLNNIFEAAELQSENVSKLLDVDFGMNTYAHELRPILEGMKAQIKGLYKTTNEILILKFFKMLVLKLPMRSYEFNIAEGKIKSKRFKTRLLVSVKNPFIRDLNEGRAMVDKNRLNKLVKGLKDFIKASAQGNIDRLIQQLYFKMIEEEEQEQNEAEQENANDQIGNRGENGKIQQ